MKLTEILFKRKYPRGDIFRGKYRLIKPVEPKHVAAVKRDLQREEQNMLYLRHPYVQSYEYKAVIGSDVYLKKLTKIQENYERRLLKWQRNVEDFTLEKQLNHLRCSEKWE